MTNKPTKTYSSSNYATYTFQVDDVVVTAAISSRHCRKTGVHGPRGAYRSYSVHVCLRRELGGPAFASVSFDTVREPVTRMRAAAIKLAAEHFTDANLEYRTTGGAL